MAFGVFGWSMVLLLGLIVMYFSSKWSIDSAIEISKSIGIKAFAVGFIFISISTSLPELFITLLSSVRGEAGLALGNIFGSNLSNMTIILGLTIIIGGTIYITKKEIIDLIELMFVTTLVPLFLIQRNVLSIFHGIILLGLFVFYMYKVQRENKVMDEKGIEKDYLKMINGILQFLVAISILLVGSEFLVRSAVNIAEIMGLSTTLIGATIVAVGTSLPELFVGIQSVKRKEYGLALGNLFGSGIVNFTLILGTLAIISGAMVDIRVIATAVPYIILSTLTIWYIMTKKEKLNIWVGIGLIFLYVAFILQEFGLFALV